MTEVLGHGGGTANLHDDAGLPRGLPIPQVQRVLDEPDGEHWFPRTPRRGDQAEHGAGYYAPLLHTMLFRLGWVRPDRGVFQWDGAGYPDDEPHLRMVRHLWGSEVDLAPFFLWLGEIDTLLRPFHDLVGFEDDGAPVPVDRDWAATVREREAAA